MTEQTGGSSLDMVIGEVRGQLREMIHNVNNISQKQDALFDKIVALAGTPADLAAFKVSTATNIAEIKTSSAAEVASIKGRLDVVEAEKLKREGAVGVIQTVLNSRAFGWIVGGVTTVYFLISGKLHL